MDGHWPCIEKIKINTPHSVHLPGHLLFHLFVLFCSWTCEVLHFRLLVNFNFFFIEKKNWGLLFLRKKNTVEAVILENHYCTFEATWFLQGDGWSISIFSPSHGSTLGSKDNKMAYHWQPMKYTRFAKLRIFWFLQCNKVYGTICKWFPINTSYGIKKTGFQMLLCIQIEICTPCNNLYLLHT